MWFGTRSDGDFAGADVETTAHPDHGVPPRPWTWLHQVHGADVVVVSSPGEHAGASADAAVTATPGCALVIRTADCVPVALIGQGAVGLAHAGWRGLVGGVIEATVGQLRALGADRITAEIGPCIAAARYEFDGPELDEVAARYGDVVRARTAAGTPALDLRAGVSAALGRAGVLDVVEPFDLCTAADADALFSHRARGEAGRQASFVWLDP